MIAIQLPAASFFGTYAEGKQIDAILAEYPEVKTYLNKRVQYHGRRAVAPTGYLFFVVLKKLEGNVRAREHTAQAVVNRFKRTGLCHDSGGQVFGIIPPFIRGMVIQAACSLNWKTVSLWGEEPQKGWLEALLVNYHTEPAIASMSSMYQADVPQYFSEYRP